MIDLPREPLQAAPLEGPSPMSLTCSLHDYGSNSMRDESMPGPDWGTHTPTCNLRAFVSPHNQLVCTSFSHVAIIFFDDSFMAISLALSNGHSRASGLAGHAFDQYHCPEKTCHHQESPRTLFFRGNQSPRGFCGGNSPTEFPPRNWNLSRRMQTRLNAAPLCGHSRKTATTVFLIQLKCITSL